MATVFAARYDLNAPSAERSFSSAGWGTCYPTPERAQSEFVAALAGYCECDTDGDCHHYRDARETFADSYRVSESQTEPGVFFVERYGLSAFTGNSVREAVEAAQADERFTGIPLWVFRAVVVDANDEDTFMYSQAIARVVVVGRARRAN